MLLEIGRVAIKTSGRDANSYCIIVDKLDNNFVLIDGNTRRKKCNIKHLEPLDIVLKIKKGASKEEVIKALKEANISIKKPKIIKRKDIKPKTKEK